jgi:hypothetical protein
VQVGQGLPSNYGANDGVWLVSDHNGDGRDDLVHRWTWGINTWVSQGNGTYVQVGQGLPSNYGANDGVWL